MPADPLTRHELDELYGIVLLEGIESTVTVLGGPTGRRSSRPRPIGGWRSTSAPTVARSSPTCPATRWVRSSRAESTCSRSARKSWSARAGSATTIRRPSSRQCVRSPPRVPSHVVTTRAVEPALALVDGALLVVRPPQLTAADHRGAGDSLTAGIAATLANGGDLVDGLRLGAAAGALNVTRRGLATGTRAEIERLAVYVDDRSPSTVRTEHAHDRGFSMLRRRSTRDCRVGRDRFADFESVDDTLVHVRLASDGRRVAELFGDLLGGATNGALGALSQRSAVGASPPTTRPRRRCRATSGNPSRRHHRRRRP